MADTYERTARQMEAALGKVKAPLDVIILLDGSSSVNKQQFEIMRLCVRQLVDIFQGDVRIGIIQFAANTLIVCNLNGNKQTVNCSITGMQQSGGGTNDKLAFENAQAIFNTDNRNASQCIVFLTDGDCAGSVQIASKLRDENNIHMVAIGVGLSDVTNLAKIASNNAYFNFKSFDDLRNVFTHLNRTPTSPPKIGVIARGAHSATLQVELPPDVVKFLEWEVETFDGTSNKWVRQGGSQAEIQFLRDLKDNTKFMQRGRVKLLNGTWSEFSEDLEFRTLIEDRLSPIIRDPKKRTAECKAYIKHLQAFRVMETLQDLGVTNINLLAVGRMGAGKSSLLDSFASALGGKCTVLSPYRASLETVTPTFKMFTLTRDEDREPVIRFGDVYGWSETNYKNSELAYILDGNVKSGYTETASGFMPTKQNPFYNPNPTFNDKIHAVIVVVSAVTVGSVTEMGKLNEFYSMLTTRGYQPIFVLTKVDRLPDEILIGHYENVLDSGVVDATIQTFCQLSNIPRASVLPVINYQGPYEIPDYVIELLVLSVLKAAVGAAQTFLEHREDDIRADSKANGKSKGKGKPKKVVKPKKISDDDEEDRDEEESEGSEEEVLTPKETKGGKKGNDKKTPTKKNPEVEKTPLSPVTPSDILNLTEAAAYLTVSEKDVLELLKANHIPGRKIGEQWRIPKKGIDSYLLM